MPRVTGTKFESRDSDTINCTVENNVDRGVAVIENKATSLSKPWRSTVPRPIATDPRGWHIRCHLFGHIFRADYPAAKPSPQAIKIKGGEGIEDRLPLGGLEMHAYLQCGIPRLRKLLEGDMMSSRNGGGGDGGGDGGSDDGVGACKNGAFNNLVENIHGASGNDANSSCGGAATPLNAVGVDRAKTGADADGVGGGSKLGAVLSVELFCTEGGGMTRGGTTCESRQEYQHVCEVR